MTTGVYTNTYTDTHKHTTEAQPFFLLPSSILLINNCFLKTHCEPRTGTMPQRSKDKPSNDHLGQQNPAESGKSHLLDSDTAIPMINISKEN